MKIYKYIGDGAGVPGLPHEIPEAESAAYGDQLKSALEAGLYKLESVAPSVNEAPFRSAQEEKRKSKKADEPSAEGD